jgi:hypothetical protein
MRKFFINLILLLFISCSKDSIVYTDIENPNNTLRTITLTLDNQKTYQSIPSLAQNSKLFFGNESGSDNLFSLVQFTLFSGYIPPTSFLDLLADSIQVDSARIFFQTLDTINSSAKLKLFALPVADETIFSDSTNFYSLSKHIDFSNSSIFLNETTLNEIAPLDSVSYDTISFDFKGENLETLKTNLFNTAIYPARTIMLTTENLDQLFTLESNESSREPKMKVWFKAFVNDTTTVDTSILFFADKDISIISPPEITDFDKQLITLNGASGLKSLIHFNLDSISSFNRNAIIKNANLVLNVENRNFEDGTFSVGISTIQDSISNWDYTSFYEPSIDYEDYQSTNVYLNSRNIVDNKVSIPIQSYIQLFKNGAIDNNGLMIFGGSSNSPYDKVSFSVESVEVLYVEP